MKKYKHGGDKARGFEGYRDRSRNALLGQIVVHGDRGSSDSLAASDKPKVAGTCLPRGRFSSRPSVLWSQPPRRYSESAGLVQTSPSMSVSQVLQHLYSLDRSSSEFLRALYTFIRLDEKGEYSLSLQQLETAQLVNFLDGV